uniref:Uncharacterized protein n=1 Tax=Sphaerodactylus townsendi TaxID=933632 RepID=A0ACB8FAE0_9SAUR
MGGRGRLFPARLTELLSVTFAEPTISMVYEARVRTTGYVHSPYDLPRNSHIPSHYDVLPARHSPTHGTLWEKPS